MIKIDQYDYDLEIGKDVPRLIPEDIPIPKQKDYSNGFTNNSVALIEEASKLDEFIRKSSLLFGRGPVEYIWGGFCDCSSWKFNAGCYVEVGYCFVDSSLEDDSVYFYAKLNKDGRYEIIKFNSRHD
jgi:hypothetical protein